MEKTHAEVTTEIRAQMPSAYVERRSYPVVLPNGKAAEAFLSFKRGRNAGRHYLTIHFRTDYVLRGPDGEEIRRVKDGAINEWQIQLHKPDAKFKYDWEVA